jgi:hypothetical protein
MSPTAELKTNTRLAEMIERLTTGDGYNRYCFECSALDAREHAYPSWSCHL